MPHKLNTSHSVRSVLSALAELSEASLAAVRYRWDASGLVYDPLAGLAEYPSDRYNRLLKSKVDRIVAPGVEPGASKLPLQPALPDPGGKRRRPEGSDEPDTPFRTAAGASPERLKRNSTVGNAGRNAVRVDPLAAPSGSAPDFEGDDSAVDRILNRYLTGYPGDGRTGGALNSPATRDPVGFPRRRRPRVTSSDGRSEITSDRAVVSANIESDERIAAGHAREPESESTETGPRRESRFSNETGVSPIPRWVQRRLPDPAGVIDPALGRSSLSSRGLTTPIALDPAVSTKRLSAWADPAGRFDALAPTPQSPRADETEPAVAQRKSTNGKKLRTRAAMDDDPTRMPGTVPPESSSGFSTLGRLLHRWQADQEETPRPGPDPLRPVSGREMTRPSANAPLFSDRRPSPELSPAAASDADFARRLENVLLRESRRHGIVVEDQ